MTRLLPLLVAAVLLGLLGAPRAGAQLAAPDQRIFLPVVANMPLPPNRLGLDLRPGTANAALPYLTDLAPQWVRAGDLLWSAVEPVRGAGYRWEAAAALEANIARIRAAGAEPIVILQQSPPWAQRVRGRLCSPPAPEYAPDLARFAAAAAQRYASGPLAVQVWQLWNEVDFRPDQIGDEGSGCWGTRDAPAYGGDYYGQVLRQVFPAIKGANPRAAVLAAGLAHFWPDETQTRGFLRGMLQAGAGDSFDALSFSAYGVYGASDRLVLKANSLRRGLAEFGLAGKPLLAAEVGAVCYQNYACQPNYRQQQADYAARVYAEAVALDLQGMLWYTLASPEPGFLHSHLLSDGGAQLTPWPAYYALRHSTQLLRTARSLGAPQELDDSQLDAVQRLAFDVDGGVLNVLWVARTGAQAISTLTVPAGAQATCTSRLDQVAPGVADCSDTDGDGRIVLAVSSAPLYVEVRR